tara:strand:- start:384 stop:542 length:159 start_codon:yes stop_codon:yes gene_type:complete
VNLKVATGSVREAELMMRTSRKTGLGIRKVPIDGDDVAVPGKLLSVLEALEK